MTKSPLAAPDTPVFNYVRPPLYKKQKDAMFCPEREAVIEASPKTGKTYSAMVWLFERALEAPDGSHLWWVAPAFGVAKIAYRRYLQFLPEEVRTFNEQELKIELHLGVTPPKGATGRVTTTRGHRTVTIWFKSGDNPNLLYGEDVYAFVIDEGSRTKEEVFSACRSTVSATRGMYRVIGNVYGTKNWAYRLARDSEKEMTQARREGRPARSRYSKLIAADAVAAGILSAEDIEDARRVLPDIVFRELYLAEPSEDGGNPFGMQHIAAGQVPVQSRKPPVCCGLDLASREDWTVLIGVDEDGIECLFDRFQLPWTQVEDRIIPQVGHTPCLVDATGVGAVKLADLQEKGGPNFEGQTFTQTKKQQLMENIAVILQHHRTAYADPILRSELEAMEWVRTPGGGVSYGAPSGQHDDTVIAYGLALWLYRDLMPAEGTYYIPGQRTDEPENAWMPEGTSESGFYVPMSPDASPDSAQSLISRMMSGWRRS
jgi:hypothetical protein